MAFGPSERCFSNPAGACSKLWYGPQSTFRVDYRKIKIQVREYLLGFKVSRVIFTGILVFSRSDDWWKSEVWVLLWFLVRFKSGIGWNHHILDSLLLLNLVFLNSGLEFNHCWGKICCRFIGDFWSFIRQERSEHEEWGGIRLSTQPPGGAHWSLALIQKVVTRIYA